ncbi:unnamed protein product [Adineta ricciae]|uniref:Phosphatidate phosphatase APP1 catalytic domain-containing protein n=1 Tax=Adineta ricciae TaxID=249248 RepID=A0A814UVM3_ADIRI|nr:unnamed protein product [Adineta ricciae]CAF1179428.1 unnamed protein product [Adineta ricciae]
MTACSIVVILILLGTIVVHCQNETEQSRSHHLWGKIKHTLAFDSRQLNSEEMLLFPDVAFQSVNDNRIWRVMIHGWKYRTNRGKYWLGSHATSWLERLARNLLNPSEIMYLNGSINHDRLRPFFVTDRMNEDIQITIGNQTQTIRTDQNGEFYDQIEMTNDAIQTLKREQRNDFLSYEARGNNRVNATGVIQLIEPSEGISVISDIDDTIKVSEVLDKVRLLANTFISSFKAVPGMPELFQQWKSKNINCTFHYLSAMPDQLYTLTQEFIDENQFPSGSFHMRHFGWAAASLFNFLHSKSTSAHKISYLHFFLSNTNRTFVLIGDSGEKDPEIYGIITREYPERIRAIFIRAIKGESFNDQRFLDAFQGITKEKWLIFNDPKQVPIDLSRAPRTSTK